MRNAGMTGIPCNCSSLPGYGRKGKVCRCVTLTVILGLVNVIAIVSAMTYQGSAR